MTTNIDTLEYFLECLGGIPELHAKAMFWEYGIYSWEKMFALACDNMLFFKTYPEIVSLFDDTTTKAYPWSRNTAPANASWLENREELVKVAKQIIEITPITKKKKSSKC